MLTITTNQNLQQNNFINYKFLYHFFDILIYFSSLHHHYNQQHHIQFIISYQSLNPKQQILPNEYYIQSLTVIFKKFIQKPLHLQMLQQTIPQTSIFQHAITIFRPSRSVLSHANTLLHQYLEHQQSPNQLLPNLAQLATFTAQSLQQIRDLKGRKICSMGLPFSRLIGNSNKIPNLLSQLTKFINTIQIQHESKNEIQNYIIKAQQIYKFMQIFEQYINKLQLICQQNINNIKYQDIFIQFAWILYTDSKQNCIKCNLDTKQANICLIASVFYFMIRYSLQYIYPKSLKLDRNSEKRTIIVKILEYLLNIFQIQQIELYKKIADKFDQYIQRLINCQIMKSVGYQTDFFSPNIIHLNYKQLQNKYQKKLQPKDIDYRIFRKQKSLTPIHKQALLHRAGIKKFPTLSKSMTTQYRSHRTLNYQQLQSPKDHKDKLKSKPNPQVSFKTTTQLHLKKNPSQLKPHCSTSLILRPLSTIPDGIDLQLYRYVNTLTKSSKRSHKSLYYQKSLQVIKQYLHKINLTNTLVNKKSLLFTIYSVYVSLSQKIFEFQLQIESLHNSLISISLFIAFQMNQQLNNQKSITTIFNQLPNTTTINCIDLWYCLTYLIKCDKNMPIKLSNIYKIQQQKIICTQIWKNNLYIDQIAQLAANYDKSLKFISFTEHLIQYCQNFLKQLTNQLNISHQHCIYAYNCIKFILSANGNILQNQNIDQILMCSLYISGKTINQPILFVNIKDAYQTLFKNKNRNLQEIFNKVTTKENGVGDIIYFYNQYFIQSIKPFVPYMSNPQNIPQHSSLTLLHKLFQKQISFKKQNYPLNMLNIMQTTKPKLKRSKLKSNENKNQQIYRIFNGERNQTRVRIRPNNSIITELCDTEKINKLMEMEEEEFGSDQGNCFQ